jgi:hypothetical protein
MADNPAADHDDVRHDDLEFDPDIQPSKSAKAWLNRLEESETAFDRWQDHCDNIDKAYASLERLATNMNATSRIMRDREFAMFWANCEVIRPTIYASPPVPVVTPKFKDRRPVYQAASEVMERCCVVAFDLARIDDLMKLVRDDLVLVGRGVPWCRYESAGEGRYASERVCIDFKGRRDFLHSLSANWREVTWVAAASYLTRSEARKRFRKHSGNAYQDAEYKVNKDAKEVGGGDNRERAKFWEIWSKTDRRVIWVAHGCEDILDDADPHLELQNYFPCPRPAYGTLQRGSLVPVPDIMQYKDQLDEINLLTARIHALSDALEAKGFYPAGGAELADAVQAAVATHSNGRLLVPIANWAAFGGTKDVVIWLPIDMIAQTITALVMLRKQIIEDIYQITGMADIMRGDTDPNETLGAQQLKNQYGTTRIRDKQAELVRVARDLVEISSEIITEKFDDVTIIEMSQTQLRTQDMVARDVDQLQQQMQQIQRQAMQQIQQAQQQQLPSPQQGSPPPPGGSSAAAGAPGAPGGAPPPQDPVQQIIQQAQDALQQGATQLQQLQQEVTIEQVLYFLKDTRAKSFTLDIETDSTIMADEDAEKQRRTEFTGALGQLLPQLLTLYQGDPTTATFCGEVLKFATAPFRAGRSLDGAIDDLIEQMKAKGAQPRPQDPTTIQGQIAIQIEQMKQQTEREKLAANVAADKAKLDQADRHKQWELANQRSIAQMKASGDTQEAQVDMAVQGQKMQESREAHAMTLAKAQIDMQTAEQKAALMQQQHAMKSQDMAARQSERQEAIFMKRQQQQMRPPGGI